MTTDADLEAVAVDLEAQAAKVRAWKQGSPTPTPAPTPTPSPTPIPTPVPSGFTGRRQMDPTKWKVLMEDDFKTLAPEGQFLALYGDRWDAAGSQGDYFTTSKRGKYSPNQISVVDLPTGERVMQCRLTPKGTGTYHHCASPQLKVNGNAYNGTKGEYIELRAKVLKPASNWHAANLGWPIKSWPTYGEPDFWESGLSSTSKVGGNIHVQNGGSSGQGQVSFNTSVAVTDWFTVGFERIAGQYFACFVNGNPVKYIKSTDLSSPYGIPNDLLRWTLQLEDSQSANPTEEALVVYDWVTLWIPA